MRRSELLLSKSLQINKIKKVAELNIKIAAKKWLKSIKKNIYKILKEPNFVEDSMNVLILQTVVRH